MKIICDTQTLCESVVTVGKAVSSKSSLPALEGILIKAENDMVTLNGYDLEIGITHCFACTVETPGEIVLNARLFSDMVRNIDSEKVTIENTDDYIVNISGGMTEYTLLGIAAADFPQLPSFETEKGISLPQPVFKEMIRQTIYAVSQNENKPVLTGVLFETKDDSLYMVACDGCRLSIRKEPIRFEQEMKIVIPSKTLSEISKMLKEEDDQSVQIKIGKKHAVFELSGYLLISRLLDGEFIDYKAAVPEGKNTAVRVQTKVLQRSIEKTSLILTDRIKSSLRCVFGGGNIKISCKTAVGNAHDEIGAKMEGEGLTIGFNSKFLGDALRACSSDEVLLELGGPLNPMKILPISGDAFLFLVLPVRLGAE